LLRITIAINILLKIEGGIHEPDARALPEEPV
jgi:hypothetical protein